MKLLTPVAIILVCVGMYYLYISPAAMEAKSLAKKEAELSNVLQQVKVLTIKRDEVATSYNSIPQADIDKLNKIIPSKFDAVAFANDVNTIAMQNGLGFQNYITSSPNQSNQDAGEVIDALPYKTTEVSFKVIGKYQDFLKFLAIIEKDQRLMDVVGLKVEEYAKQDKNYNGLMQFDLKINTYSLK